MRLSIVLGLLLALINQRADACEPSLSTAPTRELSRTTPCTARCEVLTQDIPESATVAFASVDGAGNLGAAVAATQRALVGRLFGATDIAVMPLQDLGEGNWTVLVDGAPHPGTGFSVAGGRAEIPRASASVIVRLEPGDTDPPGRGACPWGGIPIPVPPPPPALYRVTRHHISVTLPEVRNTPDARADYWIMNASDEAPAPESDGTRIPDGVFLERVTGVMGTSSVAENPNLETGKRYRVAARLVNSDGIAGPVKLSEPFEITEWDAYLAPASCAASGVEGWALTVLGVAALRLLLRRDGTARRALKPRPGGGIRHREPVVAKPAQPPVSYHYPER